VVSVSIVDAMPLHLAKMRRSHKNLAWLLLALIIPAVAKSPGDNATRDNTALEEIRAHLHDHRSLARQRGAVFVATITQIKSLPRAACQSGVEHRVSYRITENLWNDPDSPEIPGYILSRDFIDCREKLLASPPFGVGVKALVYCARFDRYSCLAPVLYTDENYRKVQAWLDELRDEEIDPALLQVHEDIQKSAELLRTSRDGKTIPINGEMSRPFVFVGQVKSIDPPPRQGLQPMSVAIRPHMNIAISKVLWGEYSDSVVSAWCNSMKCGGARANDNVIMHCYATRSFAQCSPPSLASEEKLRKVESWAAQVSPP
jgi:hypothetical protein